MKHLTAILALGAVYGLVQHSVVALGLPDEKLVGITIAGLATPPTDAVQRKLSLPARLVST